MIESCKIKSVPVWEQYYPRISDANRSQRDFYDFWLVNFEKGVFLDIDNNISYLFAYLYQVLEVFIDEKELSYLISRFEKIKKGYGCYEKVNIYLDAWLHDAYLYLEDYDSAWNFRGNSKLSVEYILNFKARCSDTKIGGEDLLSMLGSDNGLTKFGKSNMVEVIKLADIYLTDFFYENGKNFVDYFSLQFNIFNLKEEDFMALSDFYKSEKDFLFWKSFYDSEKSVSRDFNYQHHFFSGAPISSPYVTCKKLPSVVSMALVNAGKNILRNCENIIREERSLPRVGEGWISESELFYKIKKEFPCEKVVHHGRPVWLSPQHIDIYFPFRNIAIEYQGVQHQTPVEYFGGEEAFRKQQDRDRRKKLLCDKNSCKLIYVYEGYDFEFLKQTLRKLLSN